ncbi:MAG: hypothetical protein H6720_29470 [Sandaracinus sp.]|nr:hypothetical protein [Sandaracinus sp.]MCB9623565.1 hypothetical protein [Sandaracinus sp.]
MRWILSLALLSGLALGCGDDDGPAGPVDGGGTRDSGTRTDGGGGGTDSGTPDEDGGGVEEDGGGVEMDAGGGGSCPDLMPTGSETVIISKVDFATGVVELFNPGSSAADITGFQFCHRQGSPAYETATDLGPASIPAGGYATYTMPESWFPSATNGDLAVYRSSPFTNGNNIIDFVCWGDGGSPNNRLSEARSAMKWTGECATGPTMGAITRLASTAGTGASSYDVTSAYAATTCD